MKTLTLLKYVYSKGQVYTIGVLSHGTIKLNVDLSRLKVVEASRCSGTAKQKQVGVAGDQQNGGSF